MDKNSLIYKVFKPIDLFMSGKNGGAMLNVGDTAPDFSVMSHEGKKVTLKDLRGKKVILWFYPKADTPGCTAEACGFRDRIQDFSSKNATLLGVSFDTVEENKAFAKKFQFQYPLLCDTERDLGMKYGACKSKTDSHAARIAYIIGEDGKILNVFPKVDAANFPKTALELI